MKIPFENLKTNSFTFPIGGSLDVIGPDALTFLNSQVTSKLIELKDLEFQHSCVLDLAGKIVSHFIICRESEKHFKLVTNSTELETLRVRLEKFHISEDLEIIESSSIADLLINQDNKKGYQGSYFSDHDLIVFKDETTKIQDLASFEQFSILTGVPRWGIEVLPGELINNTRLDELAVNYSKGCYPGQETVAKIDSRRGAAFKPVLLISKSVIEKGPHKILIDGKKIGEIRSSIQVNDKTYAYAILNRESRIDKTELVFELGDKKLSMTVNYVPYLDLSKVSIAQDYFDAAVDVFKDNNNEQAINYFQKAIEVYPEFEDAYESLGVVFGREQEFEKAIEMMEKLRSLNPKCLMAYTNLSLYHMKIGNIETAEKFKSDATLLNFQVLGDEAKKKKELATIDQRKSAERQKREGMFLQVLELDIEDPMANNGMGEIELERSQFEKAKTYFEAAIAGDKKYSVAYLGLAKSLIKLGDTKSLKETLTLGIKIASSNGDLMPANEMQSLLLKI